VGRITVDAREKESLNNKMLCYGASLLSDAAGFNTRNTCPLTAINHYSRMLPRAAVVGISAEISTGAPGRAATLVCAMSKG
jgi:hypothetical protein